jgi:hypothetical protein
MGLHIDEVGAGVIVSQNEIRECASDGIVVENAKGVQVTRNLVVRCHTGVHLMRAGHEHLVQNNTLVDLVSQGIVLHGWLAHGVNAGPELRVNDRLFTGNIVERNIITGSQWGSIKAVGGGEHIGAPDGNLFQRNALGPDRRHLVEWGERVINSYAELNRKLPESAWVAGTPPLSGAPDYGLKPDAGAQWKGLGSRVQDEGP